MCTIRQAFTVMGVRDWWGGIYTTTLWEKTTVLGHRLQSWMCSVYTYPCIPKTVDMIRCLKKLLRKLHDCCVSTVDLLAAHVNVCRSWDEMPPKRAPKNKEKIRFCVVWRWGWTFIECDSWLQDPASCRWYMLEVCQKQVCRHTGAFQEGTTS